MISTFQIYDHNFDNSVLFLSFGLTFPFCVKRFEKKTKFVFVFCRYNLIDQWSRLTRYIPTNYLYVWLVMIYKIKKGNFGGRKKKGFFILRSNTIKSSVRNRKSIQVLSKKLLLIIQSVCRYPWVYTPNTYSLKKYREAARIVIILCHCIWSHAFLSIQRNVVVYFEHF